MGKHVITLYISIKLLIFVTWKIQRGMPQKTWVGLHPTKQSDWDSRCERIQTRAA